MADYYTQFSCIFQVGSAENAAKADDIRGELAAELDRREGATLGFAMQVDHKSRPGALWIGSDECGEPEHVIQFVLRCAEALDLTGLWGFTWSLCCSRPRLDAFGGGARIIDLGKRQSIDWIDCAEWVAGRTSEKPTSPTTEQETAP